MRTWLRAYGKSIRGLVLINASEIKCRIKCMKKRLRWNLRVLTRWQRRVYGILEVVMTACFSPLNGGRWTRRRNAAMIICCLFSVTEARRKRTSAWMLLSVQGCVVLLGRPVWSVLYHVQDVASSKPMTEQEGPFSPPRGTCSTVLSSNQLAIASCQAGSLQCSSCHCS